eukprot:scaffold104456_cov31-Tisochrysis_lutea.AAC.1
MSFTPYATAASHSMTSPPLSCALKEIWLLREAAVTAGRRRTAGVHASAPEGGGQHAQAEDCLPWRRRWRESEETLVRESI